MRVRFNAGWSLVVVVVVQHVAQRRMLASSHLRVFHPLFFQRIRTPCNTREHARSLPVSASLDRIAHTSTIQIIRDAQIDRRERPVPGCTSFEYLSDSTAAPHRTATCNMCDVLSATHNTAQPNPDKYMKSWVLKVVKPTRRRARG